MPTRIDEIDRSGRVMARLRLATFPLPAFRTVREVFPHTAHLMVSSCCLCFLLCWSHFRIVVSDLVVVVQTPFIIYHFPTPLAPAMTFASLGFPYKPPNFLFNPVSDSGKYPTAVSYSIIVDPTSQYSIEPLNHFTEFKIPAPSYEDSYLVPTRIIITGKRNNNNHLLIIKIKTWRDKYIIFSPFTSYLYCFVYI